MVVGSSLGYPSWWATSWRSKSGLHQLSLVAQQQFLTVLFSWHKQTDTTFVLLRPHSLKAKMPSWWVGSWNCAAPTADFLSGKLPPGKHHWDEQEGVWVRSSETGLWLWLCFWSSSFPNCRLWTQIVLGTLRMEGRLVLLLFREQLSELTISKLPLLLNWRKKGFTIESSYAGR